MSEAADPVSFFEMLRESVATMGITHTGNPPHGVITASFGLGIFRGARDPGETFTLVDNALYLAKDVSRNVVYVADL